MADVNEFTSPNAVREIEAIPKGFIFFIICLEILDSLILFLGRDLSNFPNDAAVFSNVEKFFNFKEMDLKKLKEVLDQADIYHIKCEYKRTGDFDYTVRFSDEHVFTNGGKAIRFIDEIVESQGLTKYTKPYRVGFGWEIG